MSVKTFYQRWRDQITSEHGPWWTENGRSFYLKTTHFVNCGHVIKYDGVQHAHCPVCLAIQRRDDAFKQSFSNLLGGL